MKRREQPAFAKRNQSIQSINFSFKEKSELISLLISLALSLAGQPAGVSFMNLSIPSTSSILLHYSIAPAKTGSPNLFLSSLMSEIKGREWFVCWPAAHNQLSSAASGMKKQTHSLQQIKICLRE